MSNIFAVEKSGGKFSLVPLYRFLEAQGDGVFLLSVKRQRRQRTNSQNEWLWGCVYPILLNALVDAGWEFTDTEQVHEFFKSVLTQEKAVNKDTGEIVTFPSSTARMDTVTFSAYCERLRDYAREFLGVEIPDPDKLWKCK